MKNWIIILLIFVIPVCVYAFLDAYAENLKMCRTEGSQGIAKAKLIKFSSPMCSECIETEAEIKKAMNNYKDTILVEEINVIETGKGAKHSKSAIKKYKISLVPTLVFLDKEGNVVKKQEGLMKSSEIIEVLDGIK